MAWTSSLDFDFRNIITKPWFVLLLWSLSGMAALWSYQNQRWSSERLVSEAVQHWQQELPEILRQMDAWKRNPEAVQGPWDEVSWDKDGCRTYWNGNDLTSQDDQLLSRLTGDAWVQVRSGSGLAFVKKSEQGRRVAFVRLEYRYGITTGAMPAGMLLPFDGGNRLRILESGEASEGQPVKGRGKVWFRIKSTGNHPVDQPGQQRIFHGWMCLFIMLWSWLLYRNRRHFGLVAVLWIGGAVVGNLWLWGSPSGGLRFFESVQWQGLHLWSQAGILFNVLWVSLGIASLWAALGKSGTLNLWGLWSAWSAWYLAWALMLDAGNSKTGWANPLTWSWDDAAGILALMILMVLAAGLMRKTFSVSGIGRGSAWLVTLVTVALMVMGGITMGWTLWGWLLGAGYGFWLGMVWLWKRISQSSWGTNLVLGLMGLLCGLLFYGQHWRMQVRDAQGQLSSLVEPRPLEAYSFFVSFLDSLRSDPAWLDSTAGPAKNLSRSILDRHYSELSPFFDLVSSQFIPGAGDTEISVDSSNVGLVRAWQGSVQEFQRQGRNAYRLRIGIGWTNPIPDTLEFILAQKFFPTLSPIPSILGTANSWPGSPGRSGLALYEHGALIFQNGHYAYPFLLPQTWLNSPFPEKVMSDSGEYSGLVSSLVRPWSRRNRIFNPWAWAMSQEGRPVLIFSKDSRQVAVQILEMPSLMMPLALGALMAMILWWFLRLSDGSAQNLGWKALRWTALRFQTKVQWATTMLVILVIVALVGFTLFFISRQYRNESQASLITQLRQFHSMSQDLIGAEGVLSNNTVQEMRDRAALNDIDFYLYDAEGRFRTGSRGLWFDRGLVSDYMPFSLWKSFGEGRYQFQLIEEKIGQVDYWSAFHTLRSKQGHLIGFVCLPFVNKAPRGAPELNQYLAGVVSVFTLVLLLSILLAYRLAKGVASPIQVLTKALLQAKAGRKITLDEQMSGGEFGLMLRSYNQMVQSLAENEKRLAEAERNSAWKEMARQIAHDIKNPLTPMKLRIQKLMRDYKGNPGAFDAKFLSDAQSVLQQIDLLTEIADTYRDFSRESEADKSSIVWNELIREVSGWFSEQCDIEWLMEPEAASVCIQGHTHRLQRVMQNLLQNAVQAKQDKQPKAQIRMALRQAGKVIVLEMVDQGKGIPQEMQSRLFELNFTTRSEGLGLGLAMSRQIVEQHGGSLRLDYSDERGTAFVWVMPLYDPNSERSVS